MQIADLLQRLNRIKIRMWIAVGFALAILITVIALALFSGTLLALWDARNAPKITKNKIGIEFVSVPAGSFMMGSEAGRSEEKPVHRVTITQAFLLGRYEVSAAEWKAVMGREPNNFKDNNLPVQFVSWNQAQEFIQRLNQMNDGYTYRLPTEAEWEYACRAGTTGEYADNLEWLAWYEANSNDKPHKVGYKHPNAWGLFDMEGNLWEYCQDWYSENYYSQSASNDPQGPTSGQLRVERGGSFRDPGPISSSYDGSNLRSAARRGINPSGVPDNEGFRLVAVPKSNSQSR